MKKLVTLLLVVAVSGTTLFLSGCGNSEKQVSEAVKADLEKYHAQLAEAMESSENDSQFTDKLYSMCQSEGFDAEKDKAGNIIITSSATEGSKAQGKDAFLVEYKKDPQMTSCEPLAIALAAFKNASSHGAVKLIMAPYSTEDGVGVAGISKKQIEGYRVIDLSYTSEFAFYNSSAGSRAYYMSKDMGKRAPEGNLAYNITISNMTSTDSGNRSEEHLNPIVFIGDILSDARAAGQNIELASFAGGGDMFNYPSGASAVVVIDDSIKEKFEKRLNNAAEDFEEDKGDNNPDAKFTFEVTETPTRVFSYDDTANVLSLIYTLIDGVFATSESDYKGDVLGVSTIYSVNTDNGAEVSVLGRYADSGTLTQMDTTFSTIAELSGYKMVSEDISSLWTQEYNGIVDRGYLKKAFENNNFEGDFTYSMMELPCAELLSVDDSLSMVSVGVNIEDGENAALAIIEYLRLVSEGEK